VPDPVPLADVAFGNDAFSVPVYVPEMLPCPPPKDALKLKLMVVPDMLPLMLML
jgi:hypothetical protein